jgi:glycosyltransferase involved in cell wall biosynthesis
MKVNMRIVQLIDSLEPGGAERMAVNLANVLVEKIEFSGLIATRKEGDLKLSLHPNVKYGFLKKKRKIEFRSVFRLRKFVKENRVEFIHAHSSSFFLATLLKITYPKIKIVWHDHYGNSEFLKERPFKTLQFASVLFFGVISVNEKLKKWCDEKLWCPKVIFLPNFPELSNKVNQVTFLKGETGKRIICLSNLRPQKNHFLVLNIAKLLNGTHPEWTFHLVGKDFKDEYSASLHQEIHNANLKENVFLYGSCNDVAAILKQTSIGLMTSHSEGLPVALLEYGNFGIPVVSSSVGDIINVIKHRVNGILIPNFEVDNYYHALVDLIDHAEWRTSLGESLKNEIEKNYTPDAVSKKYINFLNA